MSLLTRNQFQRIYLSAGNAPVDPLGIYVVWLGHLFFSMGAFYIIGYYVVPAFWNKRGGIQFILLFILYWQVSYLQMQVLFDFIDTHCSPAPPFFAAKLLKIGSMPFYACFTDAEAFFTNWAFNFSYVIVPLLIKAKRDETTKAERMISLEQEKMNLEQEKTSMELTFLKAQINPHFLFNAFNNLYALISAGDKKAEKLLADLSEVMRYSLYRTNEKYVPLTNELRFLENYVRLESIRFVEEKTITPSVTGDSTHWLIPPMVIVTFVENAIKHGLNQSIGRSWITYAINIGPSGVFNLTVKNSKGKFTRSGVEGGIGLINVRKRLDLLMKNEYELLLIDGPDEFSVSLTMPLRPITDSTPIYELVDSPHVEEDHSISLNHKAISA